MRQATFSTRATKVALTVFGILGIAQLADPRPVGGAELFRVRAGSTVLACGGFAGHCETRTLGGTVELEIPGQVPEDPTPPLLVILATDLTLTTERGGTFAFPSDTDLQLAGLDGPLVGGEAELSAQGEHGQSVSLVLSQLTRDFADPTPSSYLMRGRYDEACCDRYTYDFGNVQLDRVAGPDAVHLDGDRADRFTVRVHWQETPSGPARNAVPARTGANAAQLWFFEPDNPEIFVKLVPACTEALEHQIWVFVAGLTDLGVTVTLTDTLTGGEQVYASTAGQPFATVTDTRAFPCAERLE